MLVSFLIVWLCHSQVNCLLQEVQYPKLQELPYPKTEDKKLVENCEKGNINYVKSRVESDGIETVLDSYYDWSYNDRIGPIYTCIEVAVFKDQLDLVNYLLDQGEDVNRYCWTDSFLKSPLIIAAGKGLLPMVKLLIEHGADVNQFGSGYRPLHLVNSTTNTSEIIRTLCEQEVNVEAPDKFRGTPLRMAIRWRWLENIKELLRCGASLEDTQWGKTEQNEFEESLNSPNVEQAIKDGKKLFCYHLRQFG